MTCEGRSLSITEWFFLTLFFVLSFLGISNHEIWLDEMHHWLMARDSHSLRDLYETARSDWHPLTWNVLLYFVSQISHNPMWMQVLHITISGIIVFIVFSYAPFSSLTKVFLVFGYFLFYEYNIISRNYNLMVAFCFIICIVYPKRAKYYWLLALLLLALANTHYLGTLISFCLVALLVVDFFIEKGHGVSISKSLSCLGLYLAGLVSTLLKVFDSNTMKAEFDLLNIFQVKRIAAGLLIVTKGLFPISDIAQYSFWNTNWIISQSSITALVISLLSVLVMSLMLSNRPLILFFFLATLISLILFSTAVGYNGYRYFGTIFILFVVSLWLRVYYDPREEWLIASFSDKLKLRIEAYFINIVLTAQVIGGLGAFILDFYRPFSEAKHAVQYLKENNLIHCPVVVENLNAGSSLSGYLHRKVFYPILNDWGSYRVWNAQHTMEHSSLFSELIDNQKVLGNEVIVILGKRIDQTLFITLNRKMKLSMLAEFNKGIILDENCYLYKVEFN